MQQGRCARLCRHQNTPSGKRHEIRDRKKLNSGVRVRCVIKSTESVKFKVYHISKNQELVKFKVSHFSKNQELVKFKVGHFSKNQELVKFKVSLVPIILKLELELMNHDTFHF
jgi:hypothetical protein